MFPPMPGGGDDDYVPPSGGEQQYSGNFQVLCFNEDLTSPVANVPVQVQQGSMPLGCGLTNSGGQYVPMSQPGSLDDVRVIAAFPSADGGGGVEAVQFFGDNTFQGYTRIGYPPPDSPGKFWSRNNLGPQPPKPADNFSVWIQMNFTVRSAKDGSVVAGALCNYWFTSNINRDPDTQDLTDADGVANHRKWAAAAGTYVTVEVIAPGFRNIRIQLDLKWKFSLSAPDNVMNAGFKQIWLVPVCS